MATYRADITKNIEPAMANPATLARAAEANAAAVRTLGETAGELYKGYVASDIAAMENAIEQKSTEYFVSQREAKEAGTDYSILKSKQPTRDSVFAETMLGAGGEEARQEATTALKDYENKLSRLQDAAASGMPFTKFQAYVDTTIQQAISKYPGMADQIRQRAAKITGIDLSTQGYVSRYIEEQARPKQTKDVEAEATAKDIEMIASAGFASREELTSMRLSEPDKYRNLRHLALQKSVLQTQADGLKNNLSTLQGQTDQQAMAARGGFTTLFNQLFGNSVVSSLADKNEQTLSLTAELMAKGDPMALDPVKFETATKLHAAKMRSMIVDSKISTLNSLQQYFNNNPMLSESMRTAMRKEVEDTANLNMEKYADDKGNGLLAMATVFTNFRNLNIKEQQAKIDLSLNIMRSLNNPELVSAYYTQGAKREQLKREQPAFYSLMETLDTDITTGVADLTKLMAASNKLNGVAAQVDTASKTGLPANVSGADPKDVRAAHEVLFANAEKELRNANFTNESIGIISGSLTTSVKYGGQTLQLKEKYKQLNEQLTKLPPTGLAVVKANVSETAKGTVQTLQALKNSVENKYNLKLNLGVNDVGEISVVVPAQAATSLTNRPLVTGNSFNAAAAQEFLRSAKPLLDNLVYVSALVQDTDIKKLGNEYATIINYNQPYGGFFSMEAQPVQPPKAAGQRGGLSVGDVVNGYRYNGGDPNVESSWSKQ